MCELSAYVAFDKSTNGQTDIKHEMRETLSSMSLLKIVGEKIPPSQRSILEKQIHLRSSTEPSTNIFKKTLSYYSVYVSMHMSCCFNV